MEVTTETERLGKCPVFVSCKRLKEIIMARMEGKTLLSKGLRDLHLPIFRIREILHMHSKTPWGQKSEDDLRP